MPKKNGSATAKELEKGVTKVVRDYLKLIKRTFHFKHWAGPMSPIGVADLIGIRTWTLGELVDMFGGDVVGARHVLGEIMDEKIGVFFACELKAPGKSPIEKAPDKWNKTEAAEMGFIESVRKAGGIGFFAEDLDRVITELELERPGSKQH